MKSAAEHGADAEQPPMHLSTSPFQFVVLEPVLTTTWWYVRRHSSPIWVPTPHIPLRLPVANRISLQGGRMLVLLNLRCIDNAGSCLVAGVAVIVLLPLLQSPNS